MAKHCISCGERGVRWPKWDPEVCTARCAATAFLAYAETGMFEAAYCNECGEAQVTGNAWQDHLRCCANHPENDKTPELGEQT